MIVIDMPFPKVCRECFLYKNQYCNLIKKQIPYDESNKKQIECTLKNGENEDDLK
jgi:hypothetical protein